MFEKKKERQIETFEIVELTVVTMRHLQDNWGKKTLGKKQEKKKEKKENNRVKRANENKDKMESNNMTDFWRRIRE